jgi:hypothetical protein
MKKWLIVAGLVLFAAAFTTIPRAKKKVDREEVKKAIGKSLSLLQTASHVFLENAGGCQSCHHQDLTAVSLSMAKQKGIAVNDTILNEAVESALTVLNYRKAAVTENDVQTMLVVTGSYQLWALWANQYKSNKIIDLLVKSLMQRQTKEGCWVSPNPRPPLEYYSFTTTALVSKAIQYYAPASLQAEARGSITKARTWLTSTAPETNEEKVFQLLGLVWTNGDQRFIQQQAKKLLATQRDDGGWSQLARLQSDAYATGQALFALHESGRLKADDPAFEKGVSFLMSTQFADGSWEVQSRSFPVIPFVFSGFPHGKNQFISAAGTNWATMALLLTID